MKQKISKFDFNPNEYKLNNNSDQGNKMSQFFFFNEFLYINLSTKQSFPSVTD